MEIEKGIPIPQAKTRNSKYKNTIMKMDIGDSFLLENATEIERSRFIQASRRYMPRQFVSRKVEGGIRVWRIV